MSDGRPVFAGQKDIRGPPADAAKVFLQSHNRGSRGESKSRRPFFRSLLDQEAVTRIFNGLTAASTNGVKLSHLLFQSQGGGIGESITLYNLFRVLSWEST